VRSPCRDQPEYEVWSGMKARCYNQKHHAYGRYGGRGISICERWQTSFQDFLAYVGPRPSPDHQIDRINNDGNYEPGNVRWATRKEQSNNRSATLLVMFRGTEMSLKTAVELAGNEYNRVHHRISSGWDVTTAIETPALDRYNTRKRT
jgi:hypothetical protein